MNKNSKKTEYNLKKTINEIVTYELLALSLILFDEHDENYLSDVTDWFYKQYARSVASPVQFNEISEQLRERLEILLFIKWVTTQKKLRLVTGHPRHPTSKKKQIIKLGLFKKHKTIYNPFRISITHRHWIIDLLTTKW